eukprot:11167028-Lingulodinium_polyedra.AAC.1
MSSSRRYRSSWRRAGLSVSSRTTPPCGAVTGTSVCALVSRCSAACPLRRRRQGWTSQTCG